MSFFLPVATAYPPSPASVTSVLVYGKWVLANRCACYGLSQPLPKHTSHRATPGSVFRGLFTALERKPTSLTCTLPASPLHSHGALLSFWIPGLPTRSSVCVRHCPHDFSTGTHPSSFRVLFKFHLQEVSRSPCCTRPHSGPRFPTIPCWDHLPVWLSLGLMRIPPQTLSLPLHPTPEWLATAGRADDGDGYKVNEAVQENSTLRITAHLEMEPRVGVDALAHSPLWRAGPWCEAVLPGPGALESQQEEERSL